ncbi:MAG TPA: transaldolase [Thermoleophilia bacterium]|nr:transaldolase [Thermoleophilia bacterium]HQG03666.1 transaldolase [Thermoleophilia bacterium]HQG54730.1 transaldolase [Thermoleophilia bacterium]HQJ97392.1 transaldolase [Thermoleophilia bacterium]
MSTSVENRLLQLRRLGQSPWFDYISRPLITSGSLRRMVDHEGLGGVTSNPSIFEKAIGSGTAYDREILELAHQGCSAAEIFDRLAIDDVRAACDVLAPVYLGSGGDDGFVSVEVSPKLAYDTEQTIAEAHRIFTAVDRPNVMIKIPGTKEGIPAVRACLQAGLNINVTLLFSLSQYDAVAEAYMDALEERLRRDLTLRGTSSVASFFISRVDTLVDRLLDERLGATDDVAERRRLEGLKGQAAVANAKVVYERFQSHLESRRWQLLAAAGAKVQRVLWASTSTKNAAYKDTLYVDELIGERTVNTLPESTWQAFRDHGTVARTVDKRVDEAHRILRDLAGMGIEMEAVGARLQREGVELFARSYEAVIAIVEERRRALLAAEAG